MRPFSDYPIHPRELRAVLILLLIQGALLFFLLSSEETEPATPRVMTVIAPPLERTFGELTPYGPGFERELLSLFTRKTGIQVKWVVTTGWEEAWELFTRGTGDLLVAPGHSPPTLPASIAQGPVYSASPPVLLRRARTAGDSAVRILCSTPVLTSANPAHSKLLLETGEENGCFPAPVAVESSADILLDHLVQDRFRFHLMDGSRYQLLEPFFPSVRQVALSSPPVAHRWYWRKKTPTFADALEEFWNSLDEDSTLDDLRELYFGFFPSAFDPYQINHFLDTITRNAPKYMETILLSAWENEIDPLLLIALIYQESQFDPAARSKTGVRGLLQLTLPTAGEMDVKSRLDPHANIRGGARYLRIQWERLAHFGLDPWNRWFFALSAYNQGMGHTRDAMKLAASLGKKEKSWRELKTVFPLLSYSKYYSSLRYGYARGYEAVDFVDSIRYYYYILNGLVFLARPEAEHLAPFFQACPLSWP